MFKQGLLHTEAPLGNDPSLRQAQGMRRAKPTIMHVNVLSQDKEASEPSQTTEAPGLQSKDAWTGNSEASFWRELASLSTKLPTTREL